MTSTANPTTILAHKIAKQRGIKIKDAFALAVEQIALEKVEAEKRQAKIAKKAEKKQKAEDKQKIEKKQKQKSDKARRQEIKQ